MKVAGFIVAVIFILSLATDHGYSTSTYVSKDSQEKKYTLFLIHKQTADPINVTNVFLKEIRLMGYEAQNLNLSAAQNGNAEKNQVDYGSGFFISKDGLFVTAYHLIERAETITLIKIDGNSLSAEVLIEDPITDIAILSTNEEQKENGWLPLGSSCNATIGDEIRVIGYPVPELVGSRPKFTVGYISSNVGIRGDPTKFEFRAPLLLGFSGAAILNTENEVLGIASEQISDFCFLTHTGPLPPDINFGVKIDYAKMLLELCLGEKTIWKSSNISNLEDAISSSALVLINIQNLPTDFQPKSWDRIILVEFSYSNYYYLIHYTLIEFNKKWTGKVIGEVLASELFAGAPNSTSSEIVQALIKEMEIKGLL